MATAKGANKAPGLEQQINFLKGIDFFNNFDNHELRQLLEACKILRVKAGQYIIKEDSMERVFYILLKGEVSVVKSVAHKKRRAVELTKLKAGACFGEMSMVMDIKRTAGVITRSNSFILVINPEVISSSNVFLQLKFYKRFCEILAGRLIIAHEHLAGLEKDINLKALKEIDLPSEDQEPEITSQPAATQKHQTEQPVTVTPQASYDELPPLPAKKDRIVRSRMQRRLRAVLDLPFNPAVAALLKPMLNGKVDNTRVLADYIQLDPVLTCKILQIANSSFFRRTAPVGTVPHAMITVGISHIQESISDIISLADSPKAFSGFRKIASRFWRHSVAVARIAVLLAESIRVSSSADIYLAGLTHDLGIIGLDLIEPAVYPHISDPSSEISTNFLKAETSYIGIDHGQAGFWLGESLGLPEVYLNVMRLHHSPDMARSHSLIIALVHLADLFASHHGYGFEFSDVTTDKITKSFAWILIQEKHRPFLDVNLPDFIEQFDEELNKTWTNITKNLNF